MAESAKRRAAPIAPEREFAPEHQIAPHHQSAVLDLLDSGVVVVDRDQRAIYANRVALEQMGFATVAELAQVDFDALTDACRILDEAGNNIARPQRALARALRGETVRGHVVRHVTPEGHHRTSLVSTCPLYNATGEVDSAALTFRNVTAERDLQASLTASEFKYRQLVEQCPDAICVHDGKTILYVNPAGMRMMGATQPEQMIGQAVLPFVHPNYRALAAERIRGAAQDRVAQPVADEKLVGVDGRVIDVEVASFPYLDGTNPVMQVVIRDVTDRKHAEAELLRVRKLESLALLAGGITHDFNNLMTAVLANLTLARLAQDDGSPGYNRLVEAEKATLRARDLTHQILAFARGGDPGRQSVDVVQLVRESASFALAGSETRLELVVEDSPPAAEADPGQLGQVVQNLVLNAGQAMAGHGTVSVRVSAGRIDGVRAGVPLPKGAYVCVDVADTGHGIAPEHVAHVFDPFFTMRPHGSGLGLSTSYAIVQRHGGWISVASRPGHTVFTVWLPASAERAPPPPPADTAETGHGSVLVMDDDALMRETACAVVGVLGYASEAVADGTAVVERYREALAAGERFDAVLLDLTVPGGMGGREAMVALLALDPRVCAIVSSGYSDDPVMTNWAAHGFAGVVAKPYTVGEMAAMLRKVVKHGRRG
ncbi:MAG: PAS domain S-box protein [Myxococcales bacterium]|nr:PAS domain S-box protein [Myxococcales bacterium]